MALHLPQNTTAAIFLKPLGSTAWTTSKTARVTRGRSANKGRKRKWILGAQNRNSTCTPVVFLWECYFYYHHIIFCKIASKFFASVLGDMQRFFSWGPTFLVEPLIVSTCQCSVGVVHGSQSELNDVAMLVCERLKELLKKKPSFLISIPVGNYCSLGVK